MCLVCNQKDTGYYNQASESIGASAESVRDSVDSINEMIDSISMAQKEFSGIKLWLLNLQKATIIEQNMQKLTGRQSSDCLPCL